jgi:hypothetical protein
MIILKKQPYWWTSAHAETVFEFDYETVSCTIGEDVDTGNIAILPVSIPFSDVPYVGQLVFISSGDYKGYHVVQSYEDGIIVTETTIGALPSVAIDCKLITKHQFKIYSGFPDGVQFYETLPYTHVATFISEPNSEGKLRINISGYLKSIFDPTKYPDLNKIAVWGDAQWATGLFNRYYLFEQQLDSNSREIESEWLVNFRMVLNANTLQFDLNKYYYETGASLTKEIPSVIFQSCDTILMQLRVAGVLINSYTDGVPTIGDVTFSNSFSNSFNK